MRKRDLADDAEVQTLEDALCLVFLETQLTDVAAKLDPEKLASVLEKTARKMSPQGRAAIAAVPLDDDAQALLARTLGPGAVVRRYLDGLAAAFLDRRRRVSSRPTSSDSARTATTSAVAMPTPSSSSTPSPRCRATSCASRGVLVVGTTVVVELNETVDDGDGRLHTDEAVVFDVDDGLIIRVAVYLQKSAHALTPRRVLRVAHAGASLPLPSGRPDRGRADDVLVLVLRLRTSARPPRITPRPPTTNATMASVLLLSSSSESDEMGAAASVPPSSSAAAAVRRSVGTGCSGSSPFAPGSSIQRTSVPSS